MRPHSLGPVARRCIIALFLSSGIVKFLDRQGDGETGRRDDGVTRRRGEIFSASPHLPISPSPRLYSPRALTNLLGPEASDPVQTKAENQTVFLSQSHVKGRKLRRDRTTVPAM